MARPQTPTAEALAKIEGLLSAYQASGLTRRQYCQRERIPLSTFDYNKRRYRELHARQNEARPLQRLLRVKIEKPNPTPEENAQPRVRGFALTRDKGRKIESSWDFHEQDLTRLIRIVEAA